MVKLWIDFKRFGWFYKV